MKLIKEKIYGVTGSILCCIALFFILYFTFLRTEIKVKEESVWVNFEEETFISEDEAGAEVNETALQEDGSEPQDQEIPEIPQPQDQEVPPVIRPKPQAEPQTKPTPPPLTQNLERTAAVDAAQQKQKEKAAAERAAKTEQTLREQEQRDAINRQVSKAFAGTSGKGQQGRTGQSGSGTQGNPQSATATASGGGYNEFNLGGRTLVGTKDLPKPVYSAQEEGNIVVDIIVDPKGNVIHAEIGKGTTINSIAMRKSALNAARMAKFSSIKKNNNQSGTITYKYYLK
jgi:TonB family protein